MWTDRFFWGSLAGCYQGSGARGTSHTQRNVPGQKTQVHFAWGRRGGENHTFSTCACVKQTSAEALFICVSSRKAHTDFKSSIVGFGWTSQSQPCYFTFRP